MVVIAYTKIKAHYKKRADSKDPLNNWYLLACTANWNKLTDIRKDVSDVEYVGNDRYVFNIRGNKYRLVVMILFQVRTIFIRFIGTHAEYDKIDCTTI